MLRGPAIYRSHGTGHPCECDHPGDLLPTPAQCAAHPKATHRCAAHRWVDDIGFKGATRELYIQTLALFQPRLDARFGSTDPRRITEVTGDDVRQFLDVADDGGPRADNTRRKYLSVLHQFFDWASDPDVGLAAGNPCARLRAQQRRLRKNPQAVIKKVWLGEHRAKALIATTAGDDTPLGIRDAFLLRLALAIGARATELITLRWKDVDLAEECIWVLGKGGKRAPVPIYDGLIRELTIWRTRYVEGLGHDQLDELPLIPKLRSHYAGGIGSERVRITEIAWGQPIKTPKVITHVLENRGAALGIKMAPHDLRRSFAGILKDQGMDDEEIRRHLRHDNTKTTRIYLEDKPERSQKLRGFDLG